MQKNGLGDQQWTYFEPKKEVLRLPTDKKTLLSEIEDIFAEIGQVVAFVAENRGQHLTKNCSKNNYARRLIYGLVRHCADNKISKDSFIERACEIVEKKSGSMAAKTEDAADRNVFFLCYLCAFEDCLIGSTERSRAAKLLKQANKHKVPAEYLVGFILQYSSQRDQAVLIVGNTIK